MRTTKDLIDDLKAEALALELEQEPARATSLVVGFEKETKFIFHNDPKALDLLNALVKAGGEPIAFMTVLHEGKTVSLKTKILEELQGEEWVNGYLDHLSKSIAAEFKNKK